MGNPFWSVSSAGASVCAGMVGLVMLGGVCPSLAASAQKVGAPGAPSERYAIDASLNRTIIPSQTPSFVGGQSPPLLEVTPGGRFMRILSAHGAIYLNPRNGLGLSADQRGRIRKILETARTDLIKTDASDFRLVQLFEAALVQKVVPVAILGSLNIRIGEIEGRESVRFLSSLRALQAELTEVQIATLKRMNEDRFPDPRIDLSPAMAFADRILAFRWQEAMNSKMSSRDRIDLAGRARKSRKWLWTLAAEKTVSDRNVDDLLGSPFVDMARLDTLEKSAGPLEGKFWETFMRIVVLLNPSSRGMVR